MNKWQLNPVLGVLTLIMTVVAGAGWAGVMMLRHDAQESRAHVRMYHNESAAHQRTLRVLQEAQTKLRSCEIAAECPPNTGAYACAKLNSSWQDR